MEYNWSQYLLLNVASKHEEICVQQSLLHQDYLQCKWKSSNWWCNRNVSDKENDMEDFRKNFVDLRLKIGYFRVQNLFWNGITNEIKIFDLHLAAYFIILFCAYFTGLCYFQFYHVTLVLTILYGPCQKSSLNRRGDNICMHFRVDCQQ